MTAAKGRFVFSKYFPDQQWKTMFKDPALVIIIQLLRFLYCMYHHAKIWYLKNNSNTLKLSKRAKNYDLIYRKSLLFIKFVRDVFTFISTTLLNFT